MALVGEMRDNETGLHVARVGRYSRILAEEIGLPGELCFMIEKAAPLHDIGKIGIPDRILHKKGQLDEAEREEMNLHTQKGAELLGEHDSMLIQMAATIAYSHHERWDGEGYPRKLKGESIPIEGRIVTVADVFDALTTQRPYKDSWSIEAAFDFLKKGSGSQFDPKVVHALIQRRHEIEKTMVELRDQP
jgi:response regulator RpfG family c-di-GMP phosphodiesterase